MIRSLRLKNFKPFQDQLLQFGRLTLLSGLNSTGKSSVLQSLLLLRQSYQQGLLPGSGLALNGDLINVGTAKDAFFQGITKKDLGFDIVFTEDGIQGSWSFNFDQEVVGNPRNVDFLNLTSPRVAPEVYQSSLFSNKVFHYIQAERIGPRPFNEVSDYQVRRLGNLGTGGEYTAHFLSIYGREPIADEKLSHPQVTVTDEQKSMDLINQVEAWMGEISPGTRLNINPNTDMGLMGLKYSYGGSDRSDAYRATNVGFGITYTLPIIVAVLASKPGTLILIENPEAHLHPQGQAKMGEFLSLAASCGIQIVMETHSDHVLNGIRLAVHGGKLDHKDVQLHYFQRLVKNRQAVTEVISPRIDRNGRIDSWPDGFFDEWRKSLAALI
ncbi:MAG: DUF3696 domain-containing protein [Hormoscilla sp. GM7CHS1pb]|nr:DUF3696 domain-containing protein [Hormoscilla sp. GM7CHS1pb]